MESKMADRPVAFRHPFAVTMAWYLAWAALVVALAVFTPLGAGWGLVVALAVSAAAWFAWVYRRFGRVLAEGEYFCLAWGRGARVHHLHIPGHEIVNCTQTRGWHVKMKRDED